MTKDTKIRFFYVTYCKYLSKKASIDFNFYNIKYIILELTKSSNHQIRQIA